MNKFENENTTNRENIDFYLNPEKRTVAAVVTVPRDAVVTEMLHILAKSSATSFVVTSLDIQNNMLLKGTYTGKATCHENDEFSAEEGMRIAKLRALRAYNKDRTIVMNRINKIFTDAAHRMELAAEHNVYSTEHVEEALNKYNTP